jgi:hypothetical protein
MPEPTDPELPITGHCLCGAVRFEISEPFQSAHYCHCRRCQRRTGTAFSASAQAAPGSFRVVEGAERLRAFRPGDGWNKFFCSECGGHVYSQSHEDPEMIGVRMGAIDGDPGIRPSSHQYVASAAPWEPLPDDGLPRYEGRIPETA